MKERGSGLKWLTLPKREECKVCWALSRAPLGFAATDFSGGGMAVLSSRRTGGSWVPMGAGRELAV